jgi:hypothetical protein
MATTQHGICTFGWEARDFALEGVDGKIYSLADVRGRRARSSFSSAITART